VIPSNPPPAIVTNSSHGEGDRDKVPSAPIGNGLGVLLVLGTLYSGKKLYLSGTKPIE